MKELLRRYGVVTLILLLFAFSLFKIDKADRDERHTARLLEGQSAFSQIQVDLLTQLEGNLKVNRIMQGVIQARPDIKQDEFERIAGSLLSTKNLNLRNIGAAPDDVIRYIYPLKGNQGVLGLDYRTLPNQWAAVERAKQERSLVIAGPLKLKQGGKGLIARSPVFVGSQYWGLVSTVINCRSMFTDSGLFDSDLPINLAIRGVNGTGEYGETFFGNEAVFHEPDFTTTLKLPEGSWFLAGQLKPATSSNLSQRLLLLSLAILLIFVVSLYGQSRLNHLEIGQRFSDLIKNAATPYWVNDREGNILFLNDAFTATFGYELEDIQSVETWREKAYPSPVYRCWVENQWASCLKQLSLRDSNEVTPVEVEIVTKSGEKRFALISPDPVVKVKQDDFVVMFYDITERKLNENKLELASRVFNEAHEGILITDPNGIIIEVNPTFSKITGYSQEEVLGQKASLFHSDKTNPDFDKILWQTIQDEGYWQGEVWTKRKNGERFAELLTVSVLKDKDDNPVHYVSLFFDITPIKKQQHQLELMAHYDSLTQLPNRTLFADRFKQAVAHSNRSKSLLAVCFIDLDDFKPVNDTYGHAAGDRMLIDVSARIQSCIREEDTLSRQGGDEFLLLLGDIESSDHCHDMMSRILSSVSRPYQIEANTVSIGASCGIVLFKEGDDDELDLVLRHADQAMYTAKLSGKNRYHFFDEEEDKQAIQKSLLIGEISTALLNNELLMHYQPKVNMKTGKVFGFEALVRWQKSPSELVEPFSFLPVIEGSRLEVDVGNWILEEAIAQLAMWNQAGLNLEVSINVSSNHLQNPLFINTLDAILSRHKEVDSRQIQIEILESSALGDLQTVSRIISNCRTVLGVNVALDDFGTGYSSLTHLRNLSANTIKIDQSFVHDMLNDPNDYTIINGVVSLAKAFNNSIIAEGVETKEQGLMLILTGCYSAQGYYISRPMPAGDVESWLENYQVEQDWVNCAAKKLSDTGREVTLLKIVMSNWLDHFNECFRDGCPPALGLSPHALPSHYQVWSERVWRDHLFEDSWLNRLDELEAELRRRANQLVIAKTYEHDLPDIAKQNLQGILDQFFAQLDRHL